MYPNFRIFTLTFLVIFITPAFSQQNSRSPYSLFGVGMLHYDGFADNSANGRNGVSYRYESNFTFTNPASLSALKNTVFNVGTFMDMGQVRSSTVIKNFSNAGFNYIALGVPLRKLKSGLAFGLLPFTDFGYNIINAKDSGGVNIRNEFEGSGGLSKFNIGIGTSFAKYLSFGVNYSYIFGQVNESERRRYPGNRFMTSYADHSNLFLKGHHLDLGLQFHTVSDSGLSHNIGVVLSNKTNLKGEQDRFSYTYTEIFLNDEFIRDTINDEKGKRVDVTLPSSLNLSYTIGKGEKWQATAGYGKTMWSKYKNVFGDNSGFSDDQSYSLGMFICPKPVFDKTNKAQGKLAYFKSIRYSAGFHHSDGYINASNTRISENGISVGLGFPFTKVHKSPDGNRSIITSRIFLTGEFIRRGTVKNNLIQEDFFKITLGLNLADSWFNKRLFN